MTRLSRLFAAALACLMLFALVPFAVRAEVGPCWTVPSGYNAHDYNAIASFLEQTNANGKKNGQWLSASYDPSDPGTWGSHHFTFTSGSNKRIQEVKLANLGGLVGSLDLSDCTSLNLVHVYTNRIETLNVSGCTALNTLYCYDNRIEALSVSGCTALNTLYCYDNRIETLDLSSNTQLGYLNCSRNRLTSLDISNNRSLVILSFGGNEIPSIDVTQHTSLAVLNCSATAMTELDISRNTQLRDLYCKDNRMTEIDMSHSSYLFTNRVSAEGDGTVGVESITTATTRAVYAVPDEGAEFIGWFNASGTLLSEEPELRFYGTAPTALIARFTEVQTGLIGDVDLDGSVTVTDALLAMRHAMNIITLTGQSLLNADVDGNGTATVTDALLIMRMALGVS
ncbi:MAG: hypothetical protein IJM85_05710 [Clostridia bacterium]|nr:hypothetical protein [Clostridia bacterium]